MVANKKRLYVALYPSGVVNNEERRCHWGFLVVPKMKSGNNVPGAGFARVRTTTTLLSRIPIAKVESEERLVAILRSIPVDQNDPNWSCRTWLTNALTAMATDGKAVGTSVLNWQRIEPTARQYVAEKTSAGRYQSQANLTGPRPTWDMLDNNKSYHRNAPDRYLQFSGKDLE